MVPNESIPIMPVAPASTEAAEQAAHQEQAPQTTRDHLLVHLGTQFTTGCLELIINFDDYARKTRRMFHERGARATVGQIGQTIMNHLLK